METGMAFAVGLSLAAVVRIGRSRGGAQRYADGGGGTVCLTSVVDCRWRVGADVQSVW
jgi:hypothetical protein